MKGAIRVAITICCLSIVAGSVAGQGVIPSPKSVLGFEPGQERHLANWSAITRYFKQLAAASPRVELQEFGQSTLKRPLIVAVISSQANLKKLDRIREIQRLLADPRLIVDENEARQLIEEGKVVVAINCSIHSTEIVASQMSMELAYQLATEDSAEVKQILDHTVILLFPSVNPDGIDLVAAWYEKTLGTPFEGTAPPELYHPYAGHDNNRDWFMLTQVETRAVTRLFYQEWFPQIVYDIHQMGRNGARMFVPPFYDPPNPNIDPLILQEIARIGSHMGLALTAAGFKGVLTRAQYTTWWHGGFRTAPYYHNAVGLLTEAASARLMSPVVIRWDDLRGHPAGFPDPHQRRTNFPDPWPGGLWQPKDILDMELITSRSLLLLAARYKGDILRHFYRLGQKAIDLGRRTPPFAYLIPPEQHDPPTAIRMVNILMEQGIEIHRARRPFVVDGVRYPAGTFVILMAQPYRACVKALLDVQHYPLLKSSADGGVQRPYDIAGWTLPMQMGVRVVRIDRPFEADLRKVERATLSRVGIVPVPWGEPPALWIVRPRANNAFALVNELMRSEESVRVGRLRHDIEIDEKLYERGSFVLTPPAHRPLSVDRRIAELAEKYMVMVYPVRHIPDDVIAPLSMPRIGIYRSWVPVTDEGWTRWVLDQFGFTYQSVRDADVREGHLEDQFDCLIVPDQAYRQILDGHAEGKYPQPYTGGLGLAGVQQLRAFVERGGTLICIGRACQLALEHFDLMVRNPLASLSREEFACPGSILGLAVDNLHPLGYGMPTQAMAFFRNSMAFDVLEAPGDASIRVVARYASSDVLKSGYLHGEEQIAGRPAILDIPLGRGRVILIGFPPVHRGQPHGTFKLLFNALLESAPH